MSLVCWTGPLSFVAIISGFPGICAEEPDTWQVADSVSWGWFGGYSKDQMVVLTAETRILRPSDYAVTPELFRAKNSTVEFTGALTSQDTQRKIRQGLEDLDCAAPNQGMVVRLVRSACSLDLLNVEKAEQPVFLPLLNPDPQEQQIHLGRGTDLLPGDRDSWDFWQGSRLFPIDGGRCLLIAADTRAYLSQVRREDVTRYKTEYRECSFPVKLPNNPFIEKSPSPRAVGAIQLKDRIRILAEPGAMSATVALELARWEADENTLRLPRGDNVVFPIPSGLLCLNKQEGNKWMSLVSGTGQAWEAKAVLEIDNSIVPVRAGEKYVVALKQDLNRFHLELFRANQTGGYSPSWVSKVLKGVLMDVLFLPESDRLYALVGGTDRNARRLSVSVVLLRPDTEGR